MRTFQLVRHADASGISGTGVVAEGIEWSDGSVALRWLSKNRSDGVRPTTVVHESLDSVIALHCHGGSSVVEWIVPPVGSDYGATLRGFRLEAGLSQRALARVTGVSFSTVSRIERGRMANSTSLHALNRWLATQPAGPKLDAGSAN